MSTAGPDRSSTATARRARAAKRDIRTVERQAKDLPAGAILPTIVLGPRFAGTRTLKVGESAATISISPRNRRAACPSPEILMVTWPARASERADLGVPAVEQQTGEYFEL